MKRLLGERKIRRFLGFKLPVTDGENRPTSLLQGAFQFRDLAFDHLYTLDSMYGKGPGQPIC